VPTAHPLGGSLVSLHLGESLQLAAGFFNYAVTSNHIHLLVVGNNERDVIPNSIKLIAGRTGQEFGTIKDGWRTPSRTEKISETTNGRSVLPLEISVLLKR